ncbi:hypothetical protein HYV86_03220 [Candidatus Woesearchaeota archaeon]|nr:hypothetical protein [Candidatus Woesearchaeota archaeon]
MDPELISIFFETYLKEKKLEYNLKNRVYTIKLDKQHQRLYATPTLICTLDQNISQKKNISLVAKGTFLFESMVVQYAQTHAFTSITIPSKKQDLLDANNHLPDTGKPASMKYKMEDLQENATYILYEVTIKTAQEKNRIILPLLIGPHWHLRAEGFEKAEMSVSKKELSLRAALEKSIQLLPKILEKELAQAQEKHYESFENLKDIQTQHSEDLYKDLQRKEQDLMNKIDDAKRKSVEASSFTTKKTWEDKARDLKKKLAELIEKNKEKREQIKEEFGQQKTQLDLRELAVNVQVLAAASVDIVTYQVSFADGNIFYYIPALQKFVKKESNNNNNNSKNNNEIEGREEEEDHYTF